MHHLLQKKDNKGIGGAIVGGAGQFVNAYDLSPNQDTSMNPTAPPPAGGSLSVSPGSSPGSKSANPSPAFCPKGRITNPNAGPRPATGKPQVTVKSTATNPPSKPSQ